MISLVCQKSNSGTISTCNSDLAKLLNEDSWMSPVKLKAERNIQPSSNQHNDKDSQSRKLKTGELNSAFDPQHLTNDFYSKHPLKKLNFKKVKCMNNLIQQKINESPSDLEYYVI